MKTEIKLIGDTSEEDSYALSELAVLIERECGTLVKKQRQQTQSGVKDGGSVIALSVLGLTFSAISTLISVLSYWESKQEANQIKYSVTMVIDNKMLTIENLSPEQVESELAKLPTGEQDIQVQISRR